MHGLHDPPEQRHWPHGPGRSTFRPHAETPHPEECAMSTATTRREHDFLGDKPIPSEAYWGVHSARAVENFPISGQTVSQWPELVRALAYVKRAAAQANLQLGVIDASRSDAIVRACDEDRKSVV